MAEAAALTSNRTPTRAYLVIGVGIAAVSLAAIFIRLAQMQGIPSLLIAAGRLSLAALILTPFTLRDYRPQIHQLKRSDLLFAGVSGLFLALHFAAWIFSLEYVSVLIGVVLISTSPLWIAVLEVVVLKVRLGRLVVVGLMTAVVGGIAIGTSGGSDLTPGRNPLLGSILAVSGAVAFAFYMVIGRKLRARLQLLPYIWLVYSCAALILILAVLIVGTPITGYPVVGYIWVVIQERLPFFLSIQTGHPVAGYVWVVALALIPQLIGHSSFNYAVKYLPATFIGVAGQLEPVASAFIAILLFKEMPQPVQVLGSAVILVGVILAVMGQSNDS
jgi:drug/metabolite transporter (DMT)-like permease